MSRFLLIVLAALLPTTSAVLGDEYRCKIVSVLQVKPDGSAENTEASEAYRQTAAQEDLIIDRRSGRVYHSLFGNEDYTDNRVLTPGSASQTFRLLSLWDGGFHVNYYEVNEFGFVGSEKALVPGDKPLRLMANGWLGSGICRS